jgi:hypothetical protein
VSRAGRESPGAPVAVERQRPPEQATEGEERRHAAETRHVQHVGERRRPQRIHGPRARRGVARDDAQEILEALAASGIGVQRYLPEVEQLEVGGERVDAPRAPGVGAAIGDRHVLSV